MRLPALLLLLAAALFAQKTNWANLKTIPIGGEIRVNVEDGKSFRGQLQSVTDDSLVILAANTQQSLPRAQVLKLSVKGESHRRRNTLIGLGVGAGAGLATGAGVDRTAGFGSWDIGKAVFTPLGAIIGTIVGVAWPTGGWHEIYKSK
jgi:hypothetical protein